MEFVLVYFENNLLPSKLFFILSKYDKYDIVKYTYMSEIEKIMGY